MKSGQNVGDSIESKLKDAIDSIVDNYRIGYINGVKDAKEQFMTVLCKSCPNSRGAEKPCDEKCTTYNEILEIKEEC